MGLLLEKKVKMLIYSVNNLQGLLLVDLLSGNMKTNKVYVLHILIDWYSQSKSIFIDKIGQDTDYMSSNAWLSGFIEADGHFTIRSTELGKCPKIECKFKLSKTQIDNSGTDNIFF